MRDGNNIINRLNYMHNNPVRQGIVSTPEKYEFSSYHLYFNSVLQQIFVPVDKIW